jgi:hypothetical protein
MNARAFLIDRRRFRVCSVECSCGKMINQRDMKDMKANIQRDKVTTPCVRSSSMHVRGLEWDL